MDGAVTLHGEQFHAHFPELTPQGHSNYNACKKAFHVGLFPLRSPLLRESWLVSFPALNYMLKFSASSCLIWDPKRLVVFNTLLCQVWLHICKQNWKTSGGNSALFLDSNPHNVRWSFGAGSNFTLLKSERPYSPKDRNEIDLSKATKYVYIYPPTQTHRKLLQEFTLLPQKSDNWSQPCTQHTENIHLKNVHTQREGK